MDAFYRRALRRDFHAHRIRAQNRRGKFRDVVGHRRAEEQVLAVLREERHNLADVVNEPHVEHAVGFIEHEEFQRPERNRLLVDEIKQPSRSRHQHVHAANQVTLLRGIVHAAKNAGGRNRGELRVFLEAVLHLDGKLARRQQDKRPTRLGCAELSRIEQALQNRERERRRLPRSRLGNSQKVLAFEQARDRFFLDGSRLFVTYSAHRTLQGICQREF